MLRSDTIYTLGYSFQWLVCSSVTLCSFMAMVIIQLHKGAVLTVSAQSQHPGEDATGRLLIVIYWKHHLKIIIYLLTAKMKLEFEQNQCAKNNFSIILSCFLSLQVWAIALKKSMVLQFCTPDKYFQHCSLRYSIYFRWKFFWRPQVFK